MNQEIAKALIEFGKYMADEDQNAPINEEVYYGLFDRVADVLVKYGDKSKRFANLDITDSKLMHMIYGILYYGATISTFANMKRNHILDEDEWHRAMQAAIDNPATVVLGTAVLRVAEPLLFSEPEEAGVEEQKSPSDQTETPSQ